MSKREDKIQRLLRHAFGCSHNNKMHCSCASNIREFLLSDKTSLAWAKKIKDSYEQQIRK